MAYVENPVAYERARIARIRANARVGKRQRWLGNLQALAAQIEQPTE